MIVIVGHSGTGKDTVLNILKDMGYKGIISYTTRKPRHYEKDGVDYHFITQYMFETLIQFDFFAETAHYNGSYYGVARRDCKNSAVAVVEPKGLKQLKQLEKKGELDITVVYIKVDSDVKRKRLIDRGDDIEEINRRIKDDESREDFKQVEIEADIVINNNSSISDLKREVSNLLYHNKT